jgi:chitinase
MKTLKQLTLPIAIALLFLIGSAFTVGKHYNPPKKKKYIVIGYVSGSNKGLIDTTLVDPNKLSIINYAFVNVQNNRATLANRSKDSANFSYLISLKKRNPELKVIISIGGWGGSHNFSDAVLTDTARNAFAASAADIVRQYDLDGVDIDWEYPNDIGAGNVFRPEDKQNYTLMFKALRSELTKVQRATGRKMYLTTAVGGFKRFLKNTEMGKAQKYLDYVSLMSYDYFQDSLGIAVHNTNLYPSKKYRNRDDAAQAATVFEEAGVPASKLLVGVAFYGRSARVLDTTQNGLGMKRAEHMRGGGFTFIKDSLTNRNGFIYYRDQDAMAPYLFNPSTMQFITYDDEWSVQNKCQYVKDHGLAGIMFWEYIEDRKEYLLKEINQDLK